MDNPMNNEDLEAFLVEAELVNEKVKALAENRLSPEQFDRLESLRQQDRKRREDYKLMKERQAEELKRRGTSGKGIGKDFKSFCRACHLEYVYETLKCLKCERPTMTLEERQKQLTEMVDDYKSKKLHREERKHKWEMWKKTKSMLWKKEAINYSKWDVYTDSEEEEKQDSQPIVPKDDPNFKALEMDMQDRKKKREEDTKKANAQKEKGNKAMAEGDYQKAIEHYTFALDYIKDNKTIYTNRALAYIKLKKYSKAIKDCDKVLDYIECFEKFNEVPDLAYKAYSRKALAHKERKEYKEALAAIDAGLKLLPKQTSGLNLKKEIESFLKHTEAADKLLTKEQQKKREEQENEAAEQSNTTSELLEEQIVKELAEQSETKEQKTLQKKDEPELKTEAEPLQTQNTYNKDPLASIKKTLANPNEHEVNLLMNLLLVQPDYKAAFISLGGIRKMLEYTAAGSKSNTATLLICHSMDGSGVAEKDVWDYGVDKIERLVRGLLEETLKKDEYLRLEDLLEVLVCLSHSEKHRNLLCMSRPTVDFLLWCYPRIITKFKKEVQLVTSFVIYCSNLCMGETLLKNELEKNLLGVLASLTRIIETENKLRRFIDLQKSCYNLISNLLTKESLRDSIGANQELLQLLVDKLKALPKANEDFKQSTVALLSLFVNLTYQPKQRLSEILKRLKLHEVIYSKFVEGVTSGDTLRLGVQAMRKLNYSELDLPKAWVKTFERLFSEVYRKENITQHALRLFNSTLQTYLDVYATNLKVPLPNLDLILPLLSLDDNEILFCNACTLFGVWTDHVEYAEQAHLALRDSIVRLITVAKDKTGNMRKNSAILLAKIARNERNRGIMNQNHGMDVIKSVAHLVLGKN